MYGFTLVAGLQELVFGLIEHVDISLMVFLMVQFHDLGGYDRFQCIVIVRQIGQSMLTAMKTTGPEKNKVNIYMQKSFIVL